MKAALLGRSRGGQTSKVHLAADRRRRPLALILTAGQAADSPQFIPVLKKVRGGPAGRPHTRPDAVAPDAVAGDKAYSSGGNRAYLRRRQIKAVIPEKKDQAANQKKKGSRGGRPVGYDSDLCKERNTVERLINKLKAWRGHRHPLRQETRQLPRGPASPRLHDLDQGPHSNHPVITASYRTGREVRRSAPQAPRWRAR